MKWSTERDKSLLHMDNSMNTHSDQHVIISSDGCVVKRRRTTDSNKWRMVKRNLNNRKPTNKETIPINCAGKTSI